MTESPYMAVVRAKLRECAEQYECSYRAFDHHDAGILALRAYDLSEGAFYALTPLGNGWKHELRMDRVRRILDTCAQRVAELEGRG